MNKHKLDRIGKNLEEMTSGGVVAGASMLVWQDGCEQGYYQAGMADMEKQVRIGRDTIFRMYSMTKPITSTAVMMLAERGKIDFMQPVSDFLEGFRDQKYCDGEELRPVTRPMRIKDLLDMTSGLSYGGMDDAGMRATTELLMQADRREKEGSPMTTVEFANLLGQCPLSFDPGASFRYGLSADVLGAVVEIVSGMRYGDFLREKIFDPLEMDDSDFYVPEKKQHRLAQTYQYGKDGGLQLYAGNNLDVQNRMKVRPSIEFGGAGLVSTIDDYMRFCRMLLAGGEWKGRHIISPTTVHRMSTGHLTPAQQAVFDRDLSHLAGYSYGNLMRTMHDPASSLALSSEGEFGWDGWLGTFMMVDPANDLTTVYMQQIVDAGMTTYTRRLKNIIYAALTD
ncbi:MAG: beta-lactamase family protein [Lachnospiraceae bacterium]|nr:beta-lactamase family protein [Lachnospiraceae bacterium]